MSVAVKQVLKFLDATNIKYSFSGSVDITVTKFSSYNNLEDNCISWIKDQTSYKKEKTSGVSHFLLIIKSDLDIDHFEGKVAVIKCENPKEVFFSILKEFFPQKTYGTYISKTSVVETELIGENVYIGHNTFIGKDVEIGNNVVIENGVSIEGKVIIGYNTKIHSGVVIGSDGFGYYQDALGKNMKVPHYGGVKIGQDAEIGANSCIDRGTLEDTIIGNNVKIDNLCHISHNCVIKDNSTIIALSMLGGSVTLESNSYIAPGALIMNQLNISKNSMVGMGAVVIKDVKANKIVVGVPARVIGDRNKREF